MLDATQSKVQSLVHQDPELWYNGYYVPYKNTDFNIRLKKSNIVSGDPIW